MGDIWPHKLWCAMFCEEWTVQNLSPSLWIGYQTKWLLVTTCLLKLTGCKRQLWMMQPMFSCFYTLVELHIFINVIFSVGLFATSWDGKWKGCCWQIKNILLMTFVVECKTCTEMCSIEDFGFWRIIPGMPGFSSSLNQCSNCMDQDKFLVLTSNCDPSE